MDKFSLKGKSILVTAGSTWIPIDTVRVITNIFKGSIGFTIANMAANYGANVTLLLSSSFDLNRYDVSPNLKVIRFKYFDELDKTMQEQLTNNKFDAVIHSAAVSDFMVKDAFNGKIKSDSGNITLELIPTKKIVDYIKKMLPSTFLVKFKLEVNIDPGQLKTVIIKSKKQSDADLIVGNIYNPGFSDHEAYILDNSGDVNKVTGKDNISMSILKKIYERK